MEAINWMDRYRQPGQKPRKWNREIYRCDMDSITIARWNSLSSRERVKAIEKAFIFNGQSKEYKEATWEEKEKMLLDNAAIMW